MREQGHQYMVMRQSLIQPVMLSKYFRAFLIASTGHVEAHSRLRHRIGLRRCRRPDVVKPVHRVLSPSADRRKSDPSRCRTCPGRIEHHDVTTLTLLVVNEWKYVDGGKCREGGDL